MTHEFGVAYYGVMYPDKARQDYKEMIEHGVNAALFGISEFDAWFWDKAIPKLIEDAKSMGLTTYIDPWAWGKVFGGEPPSIFLQDNVENRQITAKTGKVMTAACLNSEDFKNYVFEKLEELAKGTEADYFFWDEPHYAFFIQKGKGYSFKIMDEWSCRCKKCMKLFKDKYGYEMPYKLTDDVLEFREETIINFLREISHVVKKADPRKKVAVCMLPTISKGLLSRITKPYSKLAGIVDWEKIARASEFDIIASDPYWILLEKLIPVKIMFKGIKWYTEIVDYLKQLGDKYNKRTQIWIQAFKIPSGKEQELIEGIEIAVKKNIDSIFVWPYRAGKYSILESENPDLLWEMIGKTFKKHVNL